MAQYNPNDFYPRTGQEVKSDGTTVNEADGINADGSRNEVIEKRNNPLIQTHNNVSIPASGNNISQWYSCDGYYEIELSLVNDAATNNSLIIMFSQDGVNQHTYASAIATRAATVGAPVTVKVSGKWFRTQVTNGDSASAHVVNAWALLKS